MPTYEEIAPEISAVVTRTQVENYFDALPEPVEEPAPKPLTVAAVQIVAEYWRTGGATHNGIAALAAALKMKRARVEALIAEVEALHRAWIELGAE